MKLSALPVAMLVVVVALQLFYAGVQSAPVETKEKDPKKGAAKSSDEAGKAEEGSSLSDMLATKTANVILGSVQKRYPKVSHAIPAIQSIAVPILRNAGKSILSRARASAKTNDGDDKVDAVKEADGDKKRDDEKAKESDKKVKEGRDVNEKETPERTGKRRKKCSLK